MTQSRPLTPLMTLRYFRAIPPGIKLINSGIVCCHEFYTGTGNRSERLRSARLKIPPVLCRTLSRRTHSPPQTSTPLYTISLLWTQRGEVMVQSVGLRGISRRLFFTKLKSARRKSTIFAAIGACVVEDQMQTNGWWENESCRRSVHR